MERYDVVIIGTGPAGEGNVAALSAVKYLSKLIVKQKKKG